MYQLKLVLFSQEHAVLEGFHPLPTAQVEKLRPREHSSPLKTVLSAQLGLPSLIPLMRARSTNQTPDCDRLVRPDRTKRKGEGNRVMTRPGPRCVPTTQKTEGHQVLQHNYDLREQN